MGGVSNEWDIVFKNAVFLTLFPTQQVVRHSTGDEVLDVFLGFKQPVLELCFHALPFSTRVLPNHFFSLHRVLPHPITAACWATAQDHASKVAADGPRVQTLPDFVGFRLELGDAFRLLVPLHSAALEA